MKSLMRLMSIACAVTLPGAGHAQALPGAGLWELSMTMEGAPSGATTRRGTACLTAESLAALPEKALVDAAVRQGDGRGPANCEFRELQRNGAASSWQPVCEGPMGKMQGTGSATLGADTADLQQSFTVRSPLGTLNLRQTVSARRTGAC